MAGVLTISQMVVVSFARRLKQMVPTVTDIFVFIPSIATSQVSLIQHCWLLISTLLQGGIKYVRVNAEKATISLSLNLQGLSGLTRIYQGAYLACGPFAHLAYRNAGTLQILHIRLYNAATWLSLIYGGTRVLATFISLITLGLIVRGGPYDRTWTAINNVAPFPVLSRLDVLGRYPFDDDLLFRGNGRTMRHLVVPFCALATNALGRFNVLRRSGVSQMISVGFGPISDMDDAFVAERGDLFIRQQLRRVLETSAALSIFNDTPDLLFYTVIRAEPRTHSLRHLHYGGQEVGFTGVINMIDSLPSLESLTCAVGWQNNASVNDISSQLSSLREKQFTLSKNFRVLRIPHSDEISVNEIVRVVCYVAILCPRFSFVDIPPEYRSEFCRYISWAMVHLPYGPYASSIRRLLFAD
ncbi:hypothetical protein GGI16_001244 [Coemansia sp. S142-1]|nr:hypothetical protein GGI16_001244 [Coemansia sp. S142-1]